MEEINFTESSIIQTIFIDREINKEILPDFIQEKFDIDDTMLTIVTFFKGSGAPGTGMFHSDDGGYCESDQIFIGTKNVFWHYCKYTSWRKINDRIFIAESDRFEEYNIKVKNISIWRSVCLSHSTYIELEDIDGSCIRTINLPLIDLQELEKAQKKLNLLTNSIQKK
ncbi:MAG TPA: hypothetical protein VNW99_11610 [Cytophagaceae bacterium]|jgi:hypothetical protein|nr:hypothetical protein [Cytophagaceae bacterium]